MNDITFYAGRRWFFALAIPVAALLIREAIAIREALLFVRIAKRRRALWGPICKTVIGGRVYAFCGKSDSGFER